MVGGHIDIFADECTKILYAEKWFYLYIIGIYVFHLICYFIAGDIYRSLKW